MTITELINDFQNTSRLVAEKFYDKFGTQERFPPLRQAEKRYVPF
ncbi:hypothetical protein [Pedobacter sp. SL55]|nr:hypothetical protein [Pedobacter sp. SL55]WAC39021.1 hypothetical protein OVA16_10370 [Pedobacter sp. SL55]